MRIQIIFCLMILTLGACNHLPSKTDNEAEGVASSQGIESAVIDEKFMEKYNLVLLVGKTKKGETILFNVEGKAWVKGPAPKGKVPTSTCTIKQYPRQGHKKLSTDCHSYDDGSGHIKWYPAPPCPE